MAHVSGRESENQPGLRTDEEGAINELVESKYGTWNWNFGSSPNYGFTRCTHTVDGVVKVLLDVQHGRIEQARIFGYFFGARAVTELEALLAGYLHERTDLLRLLADVPVGDFIRNMDTATFIDCLF
jgi:lipoate-protein ligase A